MVEQNILVRFFNGTLSKRTMLTRVLPLMLGILLGGLFVAGVAFPDVYDWRFLVISRLLDQEDNPGWSSVPATAMAISGFLMISFLGYYQKKLGKICRGSTGVGTFFMLVAAVGLIGVGTIGQLELGIEKFHEILAALGFLGVFLASIFYACPVLKDHSKGAKQVNMRLFWAGMIALLIGVVGLAVSALYNAIFKLNYASNPSIQDFLDYGNFTLHSFAFWEWMLFAGVVVYLVVFLVVIPENVIPFENRM